MRTGAALALLAAACSRESAPGAPAQAAEPTSPSASASRAADGEASTELVASPEDSGARPASGPLMVSTDAGLVPAARASRVLHVGDSMVPLVANYLRQIYQADGRNYWVESVTSSSTLDWAGKRLLQEAMYKYDPEVVLISLGSNELFDPNPERRGAAVEQIVKDTRGRPCLWISPPAWKKDTGFVAVLRKNLGHCRYLDSTALDLPRMDDGRHPSWNGGWHWASAVWGALGGTEPVPTGRGRE